MNQRDRAKLGLDTPSAKRLKALREGGYRGPVTEDGYVADESNTPKKVLDILAHMRKR